MYNKKIIILFMVIVVIICTGMLIKNRSEDRINENEGEILDAKIILYFANKDISALEKEYRYVKLLDIKSDMVGTIMGELLKGSNDENKISLIPASTKINKINIEKNKVILDMSKEFIESSSENEVNNKLMIESIVNSLTEITEINEVEFLIDGEKVEKFKGNFKFDESFFRVKT